MRFSSFIYLVGQGLHNLRANRLMTFASMGVLTVCMLLIGAASLLIADFAACSGYCIHLLVHSCKKPLHILRRVQMLPTHQRYFSGEAIQPAASLPALRRQGLPILLFVQRRNAQHDCHAAGNIFPSADFSWHIPVCRAS